MWGGSYSKRSSRGRWTLGEDLVELWDWVRGLILCRADGGRCILAGFWNLHKRLYIFLGISTTPIPTPSTSQHSVSTNRNSLVSIFTFPTLLFYSTRETLVSMGPSVYLRESWRTTVMTVALVIYSEISSGLNLSTLCFWQLLRRKDIGLARGCIDLS